jgi:hypothetical protein
MLQPELGTGFLTPGNLIQWEGYESGAREPPSSYLDYTAYSLCDTENITRHL